MLKISGSIIDLTLEWESLILAVWMLHCNCAVIAAYNTDNHVMRQQAEEWHLAPIPMQHNIFEMFSDFNNTDI